MAKKFGNIDLSEVFGNYEIVNIPASKLPQDVASAIGVINSDPMLGATYLPIWYVGKQTVNGINHFFIAEDIRATKNKDKLIVGLVVNVPPGEGAANGEGAKVVQIIEETRLSPEIQIAFNTAEKGLVGVSYKPIAYLGSQMARGVNRYIICQAKPIYPGAQPYAVVMVLNLFEGNVSIVAITPILPDEKEPLCRYAFTW